MYFQWLAFDNPLKPNLVLNITATLQVRLEQLPQWSTWAEKQQECLLHAFSRVFTEKLMIPMIALSKNMYHWTFLSGLGKSPKD